MNASSLLNADMATLGRAARAGFSWWWRELSGLFGDVGASRPLPRAARFDGGAGFIDIRDGQSAGCVAPFEQPRHLPVLIDAGEVLVRPLDLPAMPTGDLARMVALDADRMLPGGAGGMLTAVRVATRFPESGRIAVEAAGLPLARAQVIAAACMTYQITPTRISIDDAGGPRFDFLPALQNAGLLPKTGSRAALWWAIAAFLFFSNIITLIERDVAATDQLQAQVDAQAPSVAIAQRIRQRITRADQLAAAWTHSFNAQNALGVLAAASIAMPDGAWVQRYTWDGATLRLIGYQKPKVDVLGAFQHAPAFADVHSSNDDVLSELPAGQPFDITMRVGGR